MYFDFAIFNKQNNLIAVIEYQGIQHYQNGFNRTTEDFSNSLTRDQIKRDYCLKNHIPLIEIPYYDYDKIDIFYILDLLQEKINE